MNLLNIKILQILTFTSVTFSQVNSYKTKHLKQAEASVLSTVQSKRSFCPRVHRPSLNASRSTGADAAVLMDRQASCASE